MANRGFVFEKDWEENPPPRGPTTTMEIPPGLPLLDGHAPPQGLTLVSIGCTHLRRSDLHLYGRPCSADAARHQQDWADATAIGMAEQQPIERATRVLRLAEMLSIEELQDDELYEDVLDDVTREARKFGDLVKVVVPRPGQAGAGKVFLEYACLEDSIHCRMRMEGRWFDRRKINAGYYPEDRFAAGEYDG